MPLPNPQVPTNLLLRVAFQMEAQVRQELIEERSNTEEGSDETPDVGFAEDTEYGSTLPEEASDEQAVTSESASPAATTTERARNKDPFQSCSPIIVSIDCSECTQPALFGYGEEQPLPWFVAAKNLLMEPSSSLRASI